MCRWLFTFAAALALTCPLVAQQLDLRLLDELMQQGLRAWEVPGAALVLVHNDRIVWSKGYGVRQLGKAEPVTAQTVFPLASCSKTFTSAAVALLVEQGRLKWDDPVHKHLPDFRLYDRRAGELVTIRDLLSHRTGVGGHDFLWYRAPWSQAESIRRIGQMPPSGPFRGSFYYQSIMYMAVGQIVGKHHRDSWAGFVRENLLDPLAMSQTHLTYADGQKQKDHASGHRRQANGKVEVSSWYSQNEPNSAGSICLSGNDLAKWLRFQLTGRSGNKRLLPFETLGETHKPHIVVPHEGFSKLLNPETVQMSYGHGWLIQDYRGIKIVQHGGLIDGFRVHLTLLPDVKVGIGIMCNMHDARMPLAVSNLIIDYLLQLPPKDWNAYYAALVREDQKAKEEADRRRDQQRDASIKPAAALQEFAGKYEHPAYGTCAVRLVDGRLHWEWSSFKHPLEHFRGDTFLVRDKYLADPLVEFTVRGGKVERMRMLEVDFQKKR